MKRVFMIMVCLLSLVSASTGLKAQEISILLRPGWNMIGYPYPETVNLETAFGDFEPMAGDMIESSFGYSEYTSELEWFGEVTSLRPGWGYLYYSNRTEAVTIVFSHPSTPVGSVTVTTSEPMLITAVSAMCGGEVTTTDGTYIIVKGLCWAAHENPTTNDDFYEEAESGVGTFSVSMTGLNISTTYYVRAYAVTPNGTVYGDQKTFTTRDGIPTVTTAEVTDIQGETATCGGNVTDNCGLAVTTRGVCWSTSPNPTLEDSHTTNGSGMGSFSSSITGLSISTTYYVRAYATTTAGTGYGEQVSFTTRNGIPNVTTVEVTYIGSAGAYSGGNITDDGGLDVTARGVCWSTSPSPTLADAHTSDGNGVGCFSSCINGLSISTTYYVRAYATNSFVTVYGNQLSFTTTDNEHDYVDLGLPSGLLWATCNVGADTPEEYGDYFAWGETQPKSVYNWSTYQYCNGSPITLTKYCNYSSYGYNGFTDNLTTLLLEDDAATANWGVGWRMPTKEEWQELYNNTTCTWTAQNGVNGELFTASNGNSLFMPAAGYRYDTSLIDAVNLGHYWSSSHTTQWEVTHEGIFGEWSFDFGSGSFSMNFDYSRCLGSTVRPVCSSRQN